MIRAWLQHRRAQQRGCIITVSSVAGKIACSPLAPYSAAKFALEALTEALAQELKPFNIRVALLQPGIIDTPMSRQIEDTRPDPMYPQVGRFAHIFRASLDRPTLPTVVAEKIREIVEGDSPALRYPIGPDAAAFSWLAHVDVGRRLGGVGGSAR